MPHKSHKKGKKLRRLLNELDRYEAVTEMTGEEKAAIRDWVLSGHSVHSNPHDERDYWGHPVDFLDDYRWPQETLRELEAMEPSQRENYRARLRGEDTFDNLHEDIARLREQNSNLLKSWDGIWFELQVCKCVLEKYDLIPEEEAEYFKALCLRGIEPRIRKLNNDDEEEEELPDFGCHWNP